MRRWGRAAFVVGAIAAGIIAVRALGVTDQIRLENLGILTQKVDALGWVGPAAYVLLWVAACLFFVPGLPITLLGAAVFGAWWGLLWVTLGSNLGALAAFLAGRYAARSLVAEWATRKPWVARIDRGVRRDGWRMLVITRLVPLFPFNAQNYAYGLTPIGLGTYVSVTFVCMLPASVAYCFAGGALVSGHGSVAETFAYLAVGAGFFVVVSLIPRWVRRRYGRDVDELAERAARNPAVE